MKRILGLDLGTASIGWALVNESENTTERSEIIKLGVRAIQYDNFTNGAGVELKRSAAEEFAAGKSLSVNAARREARGRRRNIQRYKLRRESLKKTLIEAGIMGADAVLYENGKGTTFETLRLRAKAVNEELKLEEFCRVLINLNKKRGYRSNRKLKSTNEGEVIDAMDVAKVLRDNCWTPAQYVLNNLNTKNKHVPVFYKSDLKGEFDRIWDTQKKFYPEILTESLYKSLEEKNGSQTWSVCKGPFNIKGIKRNCKGNELLKQNYEWRVKALSEKMPFEELAIVLQEVNTKIAASSGYLGAISNRSKELVFNHQTIGQYLYDILTKNPMSSLKNRIFFRQDYLDEFNIIWDTQAKYHPELTYELKKRIRDKVLFYQRSLKSCKHLLDLCEFERHIVEVKDGDRLKQKTVGRRVCPKSSPLFQEFKIWQNLNNLKIDGDYLPIDKRQLLFKELNVRGSMNRSDVLSFLCLNKNSIINFEKVEGNDTQATLFKAYSKIIEESGHGEYDFAKMSAEAAYKIVTDIFSSLGFKTDYLYFDSNALLDSQPLYRLWHLLYSYEGDNSKSGNEKLILKIQELTSMDYQAAKILANVSFKSDYGNLCAMAIKRILKFMKMGQEYSEACKSAGYRHSARSLTRDELNSKELAEHIRELKMNSLRNPVVEKILNQMAGVVNEIIRNYGRPDEIRIEMARELKQSATERMKVSDSIGKANKEAEEIKKILQDEFNIPNPTKKDIIRYRLYMELKPWFKTLYSNTYIKREELFTNKFNVEHIIPKAKLFDDSFSNKTLEVCDVNINKSNLTAYDYVCNKYPDYKNEYLSRVDKLVADNVISKTKGKHLKMSEADIPQGFIERDIRDTQYIARKAKEMLEEVVADVVPTTGAVTQRLREDWQLIDILKELNWDKYEKAGKTSIRINSKTGARERVIEGWTKRNDHRHHAMDALTIAFTKRSYIQYLNNLNARADKSLVVGKALDLRNISLTDLPPWERTSVVKHIEATQLYRKDGKLLFLPPMPLDEFRSEAKKQLEAILISTKSRNKVTTRNVNKIKSKGSVKARVQLTPRGQMHNETIYGTIIRPKEIEVSVDASFDKDKINMVTKPAYKEALMRRLIEYDGNPKMAFTGVNALSKKPIFLNEMHTEKVPVKVKIKEVIYTKKKDIEPKLKVDKIVDGGIRRILKARLDEFGGKPDKAFTNLDVNPIWQNKEKGITIKSVVITGVSNAVPIRRKRGQNGQILLGLGGETMPCDYVANCNNHHIAIYEDVEGNYQEKVTSFFEAVDRVNKGINPIDYEYNKDKGWKFLFTMKVNEYFVFPNANTGFNPADIDLMNPNNAASISPNLFRVQKISSKYYSFRHHLETTSSDESKSLKDITWKRLQSVNDLKRIVKVRVNNIGQIVQVGEY